MTDISTNSTIETQANSLANYLPNGVMFRAKNIAGTVLRGFLRGIAGTFVRAQQFLQITVNETDVNKAEQLLNEWEKSVGIPDGCFNGTGDLAERRLHVLIKLAKMNISTAPEWTSLITLLGFTATVEAGWVYRGDFPVGPAGDKEAKFSVYITFTGSAPDLFPVDFPWSFADPALVVKCAFAKIKPANVQIVYRYV